MNVTETPELLPTQAPFARGAAAVSTGIHASGADEQALAFERCARLALSLAERARSKTKRRKNAAGANDPLVADLCRQSIYWSLRALELLKTAAREDASGRAVSELRGFDGLFERTDPALLAEAAGNADSAQALVRELGPLDFVAFTRLESERSARLLSELLPFARNLVRLVDRRQWELDRPWFRRLLWAAIGLSLLGLAVVGLIWGLEAWETRKDLAKGKRWNASTLFTASGGCDSPLQDCGSKKGFFFHTEEENRPWFEIDLGAAQSVSGARVENREDCCKERAIPLSLEVSTDRKRWKEVARQEQVFDVWKPSFATERARYVRLSAQGFRNLHLNRVRVFP